MKKLIITLFAAVSVSLFLSGCGTQHYLMGQTIRAGMTLKQVSSRMGKPDVGFGLPEKKGTGPSWLYYRIPFGKYLVVNFDGDKVGKPPVSVESRREAFVE